MLRLLLFNYGCGFWLKRESELSVSVCVCVCDSIEREGGGGGGDKNAFIKKISFLPFLYIPRVLLRVINFI